VSWLKGNLHTHTNLSDGDSPPGLVARWYDDHGYDFLCISDHNLRFDPSQLQAELRVEGRLLVLIPGEELTTWWSGPDRTHALHVNGYGTRSEHGSGEGDTVESILQDMVSRVASDGALASLNHPNFWESVRWQEIAALERLSFLEVYNGHHLASNQGTASQPPVETVWDLVLSRGRRIWGLAVDDAHHFDGFGPDRANPGRGWVEVWAQERQPSDIVSALAGGKFYSSTGPQLVHVGTDNGVIALEVERKSQITFVSDGNEVDCTTAFEARYAIGSAGYLRARVENEDGVAWTQPLFGS
jgi:hypothetical protein